MLIRTYGPNHPRDACNHSIHNTTIPYTVETVARRAGESIGQGGKPHRIIRLPPPPPPPPRVKIDTTYVDNKTAFIIRGDKGRTFKARREMNKLIDDVKGANDRRDQTPARKMDVSCRYHQAGNCRYGTKCHYRLPWTADISTLTHRNRTETTEQNTWRIWAESNRMHYYWLEAAWFQ